VQQPLIALTVPRRQSAAYSDYVRRIEEAGGVAREVTPGSDLLDVVGGVDGLLLPGGGDVDPARYAESAHPETGGVLPDLDALEVDLLRLARKRAVPVLGICRGHQLINVALGGALQQHIDGDSHRAIPNDGPHWLWQSRWHSIEIEPKSRLAALFGAGEIEVNSRHHQAVRPALLAPGLRAVAVTPDGFVEASEAEDGSWLVAVQWHPERDEVKPAFGILFTAFIEAARNQAARNPQGNPGSPVLR
jgi:putative glutamine amidotransferase